MSKKNPDTGELDTLSSEMQKEYTQEQAAQTKQREQMRDQELDYIRADSGQLNFDEGPNTSG